VISIFALDSYIGKSYSKHGPDSVRRLSSRIRGEEIANYLGAKYNPPEREGVCIWVKPRDLSVIEDGDYVDFLDGEFNPNRLISRPKINIITSSLYQHEFFKDYPNQKFLIPSHHLNIDRIRRTRKEIKVAGYIGVPSPAVFKRFDDIKEALSKIGIDFVTEFLFKVKQDALNFYDQIDIFVYGDWDFLDHPHRIPTKVINAASFGIPSVAFPCMANKELGGYYVKARNLEETVEGVKSLTNPIFYQEMVDKIIPFAENYHIENIAKLYRELK
jgi:hypothetical protein